MQSGMRLAPARFAAEVAVAQSPAPLPAGPGGRTFMEPTSAIVDDYTPPRRRRSGGEEPCRGDEVRSAVPGSARRCPAGMNPTDRMETGRVSVLPS